MHWILAIHHWQESTSFYRVPKIVPPKIASGRDCFTVFFYRLKKVIGDRLNKDLVKKLATIVARSGLVPQTLPIIERKIQDWIEKGAKYDNAAGRCGGPGCIFLMSGPESL